MASFSAPTVSVRFDRFHVDLSTGELRTAEGALVRIQQQPLQILRLLLEAQGRVVSREQLKDALWSDQTFVDFEHSLNTAVKKLRQALGDSVESPRFVGTVPKVGYRFLVPVEWVPTQDEARQRQNESSDSPGTIPDPEPSLWKRLFTKTSAVVTGLIAAVAVTSTTSVSPPTSRLTGTVLVFSTSTVIWATTAIRNPASLTVIR